MDLYKKIVEFIRKVYKSEDFIPLHAPVFRGNEKKYMNDCIDSTFVSSVGKYVDLFEDMVSDFTGAKKAVAVVNGTSALHIALVMCGVESGDEVLTQSLTFVATCNAISYCGADPVFIDVDVDTMGLSPQSLNSFLMNNCERLNGSAVNKTTGKKIGACVPMHTFGHPVRIREIAEICNEWNIPLIEDAAESIGSFVKGKHTGLFGKCGILSFNGNKTITTGGGGMLITDDCDFGQAVKHVTTTAKIPHRWEFRHDMIGYNYRMPNINAALGCAQLEKLPGILENKRSLSERYQSFFKALDIDFVVEPEGTRSNYWLNSIKLKNREERDSFLEYTNANGVMTRPVWTQMNKLEIFGHSLSSDLSNADELENSVVNIPSGVFEKI